MKQSRNEYMAQYRQRKRDAETPASKILDEITRSYKANRALIVEAMKGLNKGTAVYLHHVNSLAKLDKQHREELVERGLVPANLGNGVGKGWRFVCTVNGRGDATVIEIKEGGQEPKQFEFPQRSKQDLETIAELEKEFGK